MAFITAYSVEMQTTRKVMVVSDISTGWGETGYVLSSYWWGNPTGHKVTLDISIETKDKTYTKSFNLTDGASQMGLPSVKAFGVEGDAVSDQNQLRYLVGLSLTGDLVMFNNMTYDIDGYDVLPDGIYTIVYSVDSGNAGVLAISKSETFVVTNGAEQLVLATANKLADCVLSCTHMTIDDMADFVFYEAMLYAVNKASYISRKDRILSILSLINSK